MNLDGFHLAPQAGRVGRAVNSNAIEHATPVVPVTRRDWRYKDTPAGVCGERYWYSISDICELTNRSHNTVRDRAKILEWRYREDAIHRTKEYYLFDIVVTWWRYMSKWDCSKFDPVLISEAKERLRETGKGQMFQL